MSTPHVDESGSRQTSEIFGELSVASIAARAYQYYLERGGLDGHDLDDWLLAEREISDAAAGIAGGYEQENDDPHQKG
jgi:hypothetical protein